jgi:hypothetical protein
MAASLRARGLGSRGTSTVESVVRSEKLEAEAGDSSGTQRKGTVSRWEPLPTNG